MLQAFLLWGKKGLSQRFTTEGLNCHVKCCVVSTVNIEELLSSPFHVYREGWLNWRVGRELHFLYHNAVRVPLGKVMLSSGQSVLIRLAVPSLKWILHHLVVGLLKKKWADAMAVPSLKWILHHFVFGLLKSKRICLMIFYTFKIQTAENENVLSIDTSFFAEKEQQSRYFSCCFYMKGNHFISQVSLSAYDFL